MTVAFRAASSTEPDRQFIVTTWSSSYKKAHNAGIIWTDDWAEIMHKTTKRILEERDGSRAVIACDRDDPNYFYGWIAGDTSEPTPVVYYVYVKEPYRRQGFARKLFDAFGVDPRKYFVYVCKTGIVTELSRKIPAARFNNNEVRYPKENRRRPL